MTKLLLSILLIVILFASVYLGFKYSPFRLSKQINSQAEQIENLNINIQKLEDKLEKMTKQWEDTAKWGQQQMHRADHNGIALMYIKELIDDGDIDVGKMLAHIDRARKQYN